jgi:hypothetical protein
MVVGITISGVLLAALQLLGSYKLAIIGRGDFSGNTEVSYSRDSIVFKSSIVGIAILALSFAFFAMFSLYLYPVIENTSPPVSPAKILPWLLPGPGTAPAAPKTPVEPAPNPQETQTPAQ